MGSSYQQFCPVAKAMELLDERWTLLIVRELILGTSHFNDIRRGVPRMSPTLLSKRLHQLERAGIIERVVDGSEVSYLPTAAGLELRPVVEALGVWGTRWVPSLGDEDLDPKLLMWDMHRNVVIDAVPDGRTVIRFTFPDAAPKARDWWMVITASSPDQPEVDICDADPGHQVAVTVTAALRRLVEVWRGDISWATALGSGVSLQGPEQLRRALPAWFRLSTFAAVGRPEPTPVG